MKKIIKYRWWIIGITIIITAGLSYFLNKVKIDPDLKSYFPSTMKSMVATEKIEEVFGNQDIIMIIFENGDILKPESLNRIKNVDGDLKKLKGIRKTNSVFEANYIYGQDGMMVVEPAVDKIPCIESDKINLRKRLEGNEMVMNIVMANDFRSSAIIVSLDSKANEDSVFAGISKILENNPGEENIYFGGLPYIRQQVGSDIKHDGLILIPSALLLMLIFLLIVFRDWRGVLLPFMVVALSAIFAIALIPIIGWKFYFITLLVPIMLIAIANDYGIHIIAKYQEINAEISDKGMPEIASKVTQTLWKPILVTGLTTVAGILALLGHTMIPARQMAILAVAGIIFSLLYSLILLPAILSLLPKTPPKRELISSISIRKKNPLNRLAYFIIRKYRIIPLIAIIITAISAAGILFLKVDSNEENFFPEKHPVKQAASIINSKYGGSENLSIMFSGDMLDPETLSRIDFYEDKLLNEDHIDLVMTFPDVIREISKALFDPGDEYYDAIPPTRNAVAQYMELYNMSGDPENLDQIVNFNYTASHMLIRINTVGNKEVNHLLRDIRNMTSDDPTVAAIGGYGFVRSQLATLVVRGQFYSLGFALIIIFLMLSGIFKSLKAGLLGVIPLAISIIVLFGIMGFTGVRLDIATALLSSVMIGVGVDYTIHFLWRYRDERRQNRIRKEAIITTLTTTGRGIIFNAFSVIVGFLVLIISSFTPIRFFGILIVISIFSCLIGALVLLPALLLRFSFKFLEPKDMKDENQEGSTLLKAI